MAARLRVIQGSRGVPTEVVVRQTTLDDLLDEVTALTAEAIDVAAEALPLAYQLRLMATALGPTSGLIAQDLVDLLERQQRRHTPRRVA
jgi:hypothetical protein